MLVSDALIDIRYRLNDHEAVGDFDDAQLISFINQAVTYLGGYFTASSNPRQTKTATITVGTTGTVPTDFVKTAGTFPMKIIGDTITPFNTKKDFTYKYFFQNAELTQATDILPYKDKNSCTVIILLAVIFALNQQRFNVAQDSTIQQQIMDILNQAYGYASSGK